MNESATGRFLVIAAALVIVVAGMRAAQPVLVPLLLSLFLAFVAATPLFWLQRRGVPKWLALLAIVFGVFLLGLLVAALIGNSLNDFSNALPTYQSRLQEKQSALLQWLDGIGIHISREAVADRFDPGAAMRLVGRLLSGLGGVLTNAFLILVILVFFLLEASTLTSKLKVAFKDPEKSLARIASFTANLKRYLAIKTWVSLATGIAVAVIVAILGIDFPFLWGLLAFLLNYVPNIGSILAAVPAVLLAFLQIGAGTALIAAIGYVVVNVLMGSVIEPRFMGRGLGLSTSVVFFSLVFWAWVLGPVGMILSVPLTMALKIALESNEGSRGWAVLLGSEPATDPALEEDTENSGADDSVSPEST